MAAVSRGVTKPWRGSVLVAKRLDLCGTDAEQSCVGIGRAIEAHLLAVMEAGAGHSILRLAEAADETLPQRTIDQQPSAARPRE